jgi:hypothetical protein
VKINTSLDLSAAQFEVLTLDGKLVLNGNFNGEEISLIGIQSGVYLLKINCQQGTVYKKVVKH